MRLRSCVAGILSALALVAASAGNPAWARKGVETSGQTGSASTTFTYQNPLPVGVINGIRDPFILHVDGVWYMTGTGKPFFDLNYAAKGNPLGVPLYSSPDLKDWKFLGTIVPRREGTWYKDRFWAPEIHVKTLANGQRRFYCTFNCYNRDQEPKGNAPQGVGLAVADHIEGPYTILTPDKPIMVGNDADLFTDDDGKDYLFTAGTRGVEIDLEHARLIGEPFPCIGQEGAKDAWDVGPGIGHEGPQVIRIKSTYYLFYSSWGRGYEVGYATASNIRGPWTKYAGNPIYGAQNEASCKRYHKAYTQSPDVPYTEVGHGQPFIGPDGNWWISAHFGQKVRPPEAEGYHGWEQPGYDRLNFQDGVFTWTQPTWTPQSVSLANAGSDTVSRNPATSLPETAPAQVWIGGGRAWPDLISSKGKDEWRFLQVNVDGFYINDFAMRHKDAINDFAMRHKDASEEPQKTRDLEAIRDLLTHKDVFYETDRIHDSDAFDRTSLRLFQQAKLRRTGATINYGTDETRTRTLTEGGLPLYYMFGPWHGGGDISRAENDSLRTSILAQAGGAVDGPVTQWRKNAGGMNTMCYSTIRWCHANGRKFLYLLAPNESGKDFLAESQKVAHGMEDNDANPDIWAVSFYGPQVFRDKLETLPECGNDGTPSQTFCGAAYWLVHHLRDPDHSARLAIAPGSGVAVNGDNVTLHPGVARSTIIDFALTNRSQWLDLAPVVRANVEGGLPPGWTLRWTLGAEDVTSAVNGNGFAFIRERRLEPGRTETLRLEVDQPGTSRVGSGKPQRLQIELLPHASETVPEQTLTVEFGTASSATP